MSVHLERRRNNVANALEKMALDQLFYQARTYDHWSEIPVGEELVHQLYDLLKWVLPPRIHRRQGLSGFSVQRASLASPLPRWR